MGEIRKITIFYRAAVQISCIASKIGNLMFSCSAVNSSIQFFLLLFFALYANVSCVGWAVRRRWGSMNHTCFRKKSNNNNSISIAYTLTRWIIYVTLPRYMGRQQKTVHMKMSNSSKKCCTKFLRATDFFDRQTDKQKEKTLNIIGNTPKQYISNMRRINNMRAEQRWDQKRKQWIESNNKMDINYRKTGMEMADDGWWWWHEIKPNIQLKQLTFCYLLSDLVGFCLFESLFLTQFFPSIKLYV